MVMDVNQTYYDDNYTGYTNIQSLCYTNETNIMLYLNFISIKDNKNIYCNNKKFKHAENRK